MTGTASGPGLGALRRRLANAGGRAASGPVEAIAAGRDAPAIRVATPVEAWAAARPVGPLLPFDTPVAFLDGVQHTELLGYFGTMPVIGATLAAGVRRREGRITRGAVRREARLVVARAEALAALGPLPDGVASATLDDDAPPHPLADHDRARAVVDAARADLEVAVAAAYRRDDPDGWLLVDGTLTVSPEWSRDPRMIGVIKSHGSLPFEGEALERYLTLPALHRSAVFVPAVRQVTPVHAWALRLWPWHGRDLFHGLVRVESASADDPTARADLLSRHLLAERAPLANDPRQDRLLYGIHDVERWLRVAAR